ETFGRLLKAGISSIAYIEGKTAPGVEADLGAEIGVAGFTIQRYKAGALPPEPRTVQILATACVRRGLLGRAWLDAFLRAAPVAAPDQLLDQLCPLASPPNAARWRYENLPAPTYSQFVKRDQAFADVLEGLAHHLPVVLLVGLGGTGKTSLA